MSAIPLTLRPTTEKHLRPFDMRRDLEPAADLIELCFAETLTADGRRYLCDMRSAANKNSSHWAMISAMRTSLPLAGFVWEEDGQVVGNLNLAPFFHWGRRIYLIANVAVNPNYRRRGIARALTKAALKKSHRWRAHEVWLHVQDDNPAAINLYTSMGFQPRIRRSTWNIAPKSLQGETPPGVRVTTRSRHNWKLQRKWLKQNYPLDLRWHIPLKFQALKPGLWNKLYRFFAEIRVRHWAALSKDRLLGVLTWQATHRHLDRLWLAASPETEEAALQAILPFIQREKYLRRPLSLDYPADRAVGILEMTGFEHQHTLIWMKVKS